jgi:hypothetical protein
MCESVCGISLARYSPLAERKLLYNRPHHRRRQCSRVCAVKSILGEPIVDSELVLELRGVFAYTQISRLRVMCASCIGLKFANYLDYKTTQVFKFCIDELLGVFLVHIGLHQVRN